MRGHAEHAKRMTALFPMQGEWRGTPDWSLKHLEFIQQSPCFGDQEELTHLKAGDPCTEVTRGDAAKNLRPSTADSMIALDSMDTGSPAQDCGAEW